MEAKKIILVAGPESTGTRMLSDILCGHPQITGMPEGKKHEDFFDDVWTPIEKREGDIVFPTYNTKYALTRRSVPHGIEKGAAAQYMSMPHFDEFNMVCKNNGHRLLVFIPVRSYVPHISSWASSRASCNGNMQNAMNQYAFAYSGIMKFVTSNNLPWQFVPIEALLLDPEDFIQSTFLALNLEEHPIDKELFNPNRKHYEKLRKNK